MKNSGYTGIIAVLFFLSCSIKSYAMIEEYHIKAGYLYNFTKFVTWSKDSGNNINICVTGFNPFEEYLNLLNGKLSGGKTIKVHQGVEAHAFKSCHLLFISKSLSGEISNVIYETKDKSILTVSDIPGFIERGGMIEMYNDHGKIKLKLNISAAKKENIMISSKLVSIASKVY